MSTKKTTPEVKTEEVVSAQEPVQEPTAPIVQLGQIVAYYAHATDTEGNPTLDTFPAIVVRGTPDGLLLTVFTDNGYHLAICPYTHITEPKAGHWTEEL